MRIALIGGDGQLGSDLAKNLEGKDVVLLYYPEFDVTKFGKTKKILLEIQPDIVINTAAYHKVDECEDNASKSFLLNSIAIRDLALICREIGSVLVHFSTDYVFDGKKNEPYVENDVPNPLNVYGVSKLAGEYFISNIMRKYFIIRTCGLYGEAGCWGKGSNFVDTIMSMANRDEQLKVVDDQKVTPTSTAELAESIVELIDTDDYGLYHMTNEGECTWFEFAKKIISFTKKNVAVIPIDSKTYGAKALRPSYSVLENKRAKEVGITGLSHWEEALKHYLIKKRYLSS